jgi:hypothetical protein
MKEILQSPQKYKCRSLSFGRFLIFLGIIFIIFFVFFKIISAITGSNSTGFLKGLYDFSISTAPESIAALGLIILFFGFLLIFFSRQFAKLAEIADEIEKCEEEKE